MNAKKTPLAQVNEDHGGKAKLVDKVLGLIDGDEDQDSLKARLTKASNKKLLRLLAISGTVKEKFGSADKLASAVADKILAGERRRPLKAPQAAVVAAAAAAKKKPAAKKPAAAKKASAKAPAKKAPAAKKPAAKKPAKR
jgi:hypothetical protein